MCECVCGVWCVCVIQNHWRNKLTLTGVSQDLHHKSKTSILFSKNSNKIFFPEYSSSPNSANADSM